MAETSSKSRGWLWLAIPATLLLAFLVAMNTYLLLHQNDGDSKKREVQEDQQPSAPPIYVKVDPFTVNLQGDQYGRLLYVGLSLQVGDEETRDFLRENMPQVRSRLLILHSAQSPQKLATTEGKEALAAAIIQTLSTPMAAGQPELHIDDVLFTEFIVQ